MFKSIERAIRRGHVRLVYDAAVQRHHYERRARHRKWVRL